MLRIVGGKASGCRLILPQVDCVRPATDRIRESLFAILNQELKRKIRVLDLFAGSGAMGLEAISRGAVHCTFVERDKKALKALRANVIAVGLPKKCTVLSRDLSDGLRLEQKAALAFADPPFAFFDDAEGRAFLKKLLTDLQQFLLEPHGKIVLRHEDKNEREAAKLIDKLGFELVLARTYGRSFVKILQVA